MKQMKDSGIEWIGQIPEDWEVLRIKDIAKIRTGGTESRADGADNYSTDFGMLWIKPNDLQEFKIIDKTSEYLNDKAQANIVAFPPYTFFVCCIGSIGKFGITNKKAYCNQQINGIIINDIESKKFCMYAIMSQVGQHWYYATGNVVKILNAYNQGRIYIVKPNQKEQQKIANFIDYKCARIDNLIAHEQSTIEELKAYKQSVIIESVTKGLDKSVPVKDSGVEWMGEVPESWCVLAIKRLFLVVSGATPKSDKSEFWDGSIKWITPADYKTEDIYINGGKRSITEAGLKSCNTTMIPPNNIIFSKRAPIGAVAINNSELCTNQGCMACIAKEDLAVKYFYYVMSVFTEQYEFLGTGTTFKEISLNDFKDFLLPYPHIQEQIQIADYLDKKCADIDSLISIKQQKIEELKEYKKSLIYEYVTGKKEVA